MQWDAHKKRKTKEPRKMEYKDSVSNIFLSF